MQLLVMFRATLKFRKFKVTLNPMYRIYLNFTKSYILSCLLKFYNKKKSPCRFGNGTLTKITPFLSEPF